MCVCLSGRQENQLSKVIDKNAELTIENCDLKKQAQELHQVYQYNNTLSGYVCVCPFLYVSIIPIFFPPVI